MVFDSEKEPSFFFVRPTQHFRATSVSLCRHKCLSESPPHPSCACFSKVSYRQGADQVKRNFTKKQPATVAGLLACLRAMATAFKASLEGCCQGLGYARRCCPYSEAKRCLKLRAHQRPLMFKAIASNVALRFAHHKVLLVHNHFGFVNKRAFSSSQGEVVQTTRRHPLPKPPRGTGGPCQQPSPAGGVANTPRAFAARDHIIHSAIALALEQLLKGEASNSIKVNSTFVFQRPRALQGVHSALAHIKHHWPGLSWFLAFEIKCYDTIDRARQLAFLQERIDDPKCFVLMHQLNEAGASVHHLRRAAVRPVTPPIAADVTPPNPQQPLSTVASGEPNLDTRERTTVVCKVKKQPPAGVCYKPASFGPLKPKLVKPVVYGQRSQDQSSAGLWTKSVWLQSALLNTGLPLSYVSFGPPKQRLNLTPNAFSLTRGVVKQLFKHHRCSSSVPADTGRWKPGQLWRLVYWALGLRDLSTPRLRTFATLSRFLDCYGLKQRWCAAASRHAVASKHRGLNHPAKTSVQALVSTRFSRHPSLCFAKNKAKGFVAHRLAVYSRSVERPKALCLQNPRLAQTKAGFYGLKYPQLTTSSTALKLGCLLIKGPLMLAAAEAWKGCLRVQVLCRPKGSGLGPVAPRPCLLVRAWLRHAQRLFLSKQNKAVLQLFKAFRQRPKPYSTTQP